MKELDKVIGYTSIMHCIVRACMRGIFKAPENLFNENEKKHRNDSVSRSWTCSNK